MITQVPCQAFGTHRKVTMQMPRSRNRPNKHREPENRKARGTKLLKLELPDYEFNRKIDRGGVSPEEMKFRLKKQGIIPNKPYNERSVYISCTGDLIDAYVPPEGDGKASLLSTSGAKERAIGLSKKGKSYMSVRKIRSYEEDFDPRTFVDQAQDIYIKANEAFAAGDEDEMHKYITEKLFPEMILNAKRKTIRWSFIKSLEPPRVVHARHMEVLQKGNLFAQVTVRFNTQQTLAVYDRFGRLIHGNEVVAKDVLEYVVFEKHIANLYGQWRIHSKIVPDWMEAKPAGRITQVLYAQPEEEDEEEENESQEVTHAAEVKEEDSLYDRFGRLLGRSK